MSGAVVSYWVVGFAGRLHLSDGIWDGGVDACIIPSIEAVDWRFDARHCILLRRPAVEDESGRQVTAVGREPECLTATPAVAANKELAIRSGEFQRIIRRGIQIRGHLVGIQVAYGFHRFAFRKIAAAAAVRAHAGQKIGSGRDVARRGHLIRQILYPVGHAENFMDDQNHGSLALRFGINDKCFYRAAIVLNGDPFAVARRFFERRACPILCPSDLRCAKNQQGNQGDAFHSVISPSSRASLAGHGLEASVQNE